MTGENDAADPARTIELLWGGGADGEGRTGLSLGRIVATAIELADADGLAALSMRRIAERLGFTTMSLYRHVPGRAELVELMRDAAVGELARVEPADDGWRAGLDAWARAHWALHLRHPWLVHTGGSRRLPGPNILADYERALLVAEGTGLPPSEIVAVVSLVGGFVSSAARQADEAVREERSSGVSHERWWQDRGELFDHMDPYPALGRIWLAGAFDEPEDPFDFGLARTLDGVELLVRRRRVEKRDEKRDENTATASVAGCSVCGGPIDGGARGRPRDYCSRACQQRAYRQRHAGR
ncbi:TetR/AcrR family transcriptional regulator [Solihabitans fulvus]|uniref:TetR/AcrR family transcriptional regulator n=1 Tax=Solihabitans fulvus TaxID=1892852 RepID=A0A5B2WZ22_9PSEU|nr:TetR/AcrR family transcriptional regulator [Solihabitans fulvus]KAA2255972.1 TetR/AcrR family transcriptional regulator [Solihabitans fulvus]